ncbi:sugar phosphate isomerase/epimerase [uncultured Metabacillus sp.]|uniref:sugar phosphate isomerase/epimerase family protein n=1 Tax=uncultured Metabacillus sp. TaxID=2860135 RepID=UPI0026152653|nr:sugar phosphate isomerase/epimerase family protein [uncultured Metabacillus sp.]
MFHFKLALNTSTLIPFKLDVKEQVNIAAEAGYDGIELWVKDIEEYLDNGGSIKELRGLIEDSGISVVNAITFFKWTDVNEEIRKKGLDQAEREITLLKKLGCKAVAAPPSGHVEGVSLETIALHFGQLANLARRIGVEPYLEFWGKSKRLSKLSEALFIAMESGVPDVKVLLDPFHMYTGGSKIENLDYLRANNIGIVHVNDYPSTPKREHISDRDRVFPGDGIAPNKKLASLLNQIGYNGFLSLELFCENFDHQSPLEVASKGIEKIKQAYILED